MAKSRLVIEIPSSSATSRASSTTRSRGREPVKVLGAKSVSNAAISKRRTRSSEASAIGGVTDDEGLTDDRPPPSMIRLSMGKKGKGKAVVGRESMSSISTVNDYATSSNYSTPGTSAVATPAPTTKEENGASSSQRRRGRPVSSLANPLPPATSNAFQRAKSLRNSEFSLNPIGNKRKRTFLDEDEEVDSDNSPDAQIAKALQEQENSKLGTLFDDEMEQDITPRRAARSLRAIRPKADYVSDFSNVEADIKPLSLQKMKTTVVARSTSTKVSTVRGPKKAKIAATDSEESESELSEIDESSASEFEDSASSTNKQISLQSKQSRMEKVVNQQSMTFRSRDGGVKSRGHSHSRPQLSSGRPGFAATSTLKNEDTESLVSALTLTTASAIPSDNDDLFSELSDILYDSDNVEDDDDANIVRTALADRAPRAGRNRYELYVEKKMERRAALDRARLESHHPELLTMWKDLENLPAIKTVRAEQPTNISRLLKPFQLEGLSWMQAMEKTDWGGGLLGDEMGMGKTIQAVSLIMSDYPAKSPSLVLIPPVALMQWQQEIGDYTDGTLKTFVFHGTNKNTKDMSLKELKKFDVILMSYNSLESMYRHQEKGFKRKDSLHFQKSVIHQLHFHRVILDEAHNIKTRTTGVAKACFALKADHKWCLSGTPLQNRIGEFFSLVRFLDIRPFACYFCKQCPCSTLEWSMNADNRCTSCAHSGMQHVSVFNQELLNPIQKHGNKGLGKIAFGKLRLLTDRFMLRRVKRDHSSAMELPAKEIQVDRQFFGEEENDFAASIMNSGTRKFETYVAQGVLLNNYANVFGLIMQMRQVADHPDLILKKNGDGGQNILVCCICDETAEEPIRSTCRHDFCRSCVRNYLKSSDETNIQPDCPQCHIPLSIDLEQPEMEQDQQMVKKSSIINRIKMENWTSSSKIEALVHDLHSLRSHNSSSKSIIFSQFTTMLQLVEWRLRRAGITTVMLDGSMTPAQRQASINHFMSDVNVECFLVSLKAGGVALNLTEASKVFIVDPWWNPAAEWQSADRCHRIGQCRPCSITRLCIEDSVESRMVLLQEKKANMINSTINADDSAMESLTPEDMQFLFRGT